ncbi:hypothetical protein AB205_0218420 [Aquarana catesbeiana]|uniref:SEA domain-containing protein n=1 Tax=Aquarana catesbeiana TaxID=8400 RepID=A0A2G9RD38_AQUCT|nr:hypothetical protein AB205_0218420 [Aquarana catesbeiana]
MSSILSSSTLSIALSSFVSCIGLLLTKIVHTDEDLSIDFTIIANVNEKTIMQTVNGFKETVMSLLVHHFNLGRRMPGFDYGPDGFGTGLTPLHLSDDGEGGAFHFHEPPPPYTAYKYSDIQHPDDPPPPYEASICPDIILCSTTDQVTRQSTVLGQLSTASSSNASSPQTTEEPLPPSGLQLPQPQQETEDAEGSSLLVAPSILQNEAFSSPGQTGPSPSNCSLNTVV